MSAHTPGPWQVIGSTVYGNALRARLPHNGADARLIAAAPDLLEALREIADQAEYRLRKGPDNGDEQTLRIARAAIAKATEGSSD